MVAALGERRGHRRHGRLETIVKEEYLIQTKYLDSEYLSHRGTFSSSGNLPPSPRPQYRASSVLLFPPALYLPLRGCNFRAIEPPGFAEA